MIPLREAYPCAGALPWFHCRPTPCGHHAPILAASFPEEPSRRPALALPIYAVALIMSFLSDLLGTIAAKIAGDGWPR